MKLPNMPTMVPAPDSTAQVVHFRWPWDGPTECGLVHGASMTSAWDVTCRACLEALDIGVDDRTPQQKERDRAGALWRMWTS